MESQTEEGADLTSPEEVEEVGEGEPVAGMMVMILAWILDPPDPEGIAFPPRNDHILDFLTVFHCSPFRPGKGRGGGGTGFRDGGRGRARDGDRTGKSGNEALPRSLAGAKAWQKSDDGVRAESSSAPLQKIFMTNETQEQLKELLRDLQSQEYDDAYE